MLNFGQLTEQQFKEIRDNPARSKKALRDWLIVYLGVYLYSTAVDDDNSSPLDFVWDIFSKCVLGDEGDDKWSVLGMAARGSQKTLACAVLEFLALLFDKDRDIIHMASIEAQAQVCYGYVKSYAMKPGFMPDRIESTLMTATKSSHGRALTVTQGTMNATNAHHGGLLVLDEVDLLPKNIFDEAGGMLTTSILARGMTVYISSRKEPFGRIEDLLKKAAEPDSDIKVHKWGLLEQCEPCPDSRSGTKRVDYYVDEHNLISLQHSEYLREANRTKYIKVSGYEGCHRCGAFSFCKGNLKKPKPPNLYYSPIDAAVKLFKKEDLDFFKAQRLNRKPSKVGLVYPSWDEIKHLRTFSEMYTILTGVQRENVSLDMLLKVLTDANCRPCIGIDWGFTSPFVALLMFIDGQDRVYVVDHISHTGKSDQECVLAIYERWGNIECLKSLTVEFFPDIENPSGIKEITNLINNKQLNWFVHKKVEKDIDLGIGIVRNFLRVPGTTEPRLYVHHSIDILKDEMRRWHYAIRKSDREILEKPEDANNHAQDALRYPLATIYWKVFASLYSEAMDESTGSGSGDKPMDAAPKTIASKIGLDPQSLDEAAAEHKIKKGYAGGGGGGGFSWSM